MNDQQPFHGHVIQRPGPVARCGGPALCSGCRWEQEMVKLHEASCQRLRPPPSGFPFDTFSCNCRAGKGSSPYE